MGALKTVDLYTKSKGRPCLYNFSAFKNNKQSFIIIHCVPSEDIYNSIKSSFARWRKKNKVAPGFTFEIYEEHIVIWRRLIKNP